MEVKCFLMIVLERVRMPWEGQTLFFSHFGQVSACWLGSEPSAL